MNVRYRVELDQAEQEALMALVNGGRHPARKLKRAQILLAAHAGVDDEAIVRAVGTSGSTVYRTKRRFVEESLDAPLPGAASSIGTTSSSKISARGSGRRRSRVLAFRDGGRGSASKR